MTSIPPPVAAGDAPLPPSPARGAPLLDLPDPPTARTRALHASMRAHESTARGSRKALTVMVGATVVCALAFVLILLLRTT